MRAGSPALTHRVNKSLWLLPLWLHMLGVGVVTGNAGTPVSPPHSAPLLFARLLTFTCGSVAQASCCSACFRVCLNLLKTHYLPACFLLHFRDPAGKPASYLPAKLPAPLSHCLLNYVPAPEAKVLELLALWKERKTAATLLAPLLDQYLYILEPCSVPLQLLN